MLRGWPLMLVFARMQEGSRFELSTSTLSSGCLGANWPITAGTEHYFQGPDRLVAVHCGRQSAI